MSELSDALGVPHVELVSERHCFHYALFVDLQPFFEEFGYLALLLFWLRGHFTQILGFSVVRIK